MGNSGPDERRDVPSAQGQTANGDLASAETPAAGDFGTVFAAIGRSPDAPAHLARCLRPGLPGRG